MRKERQKILERIYPLNFFPIQDDMFSKRQESTRNWLLEPMPFKGWITEHGEILWCHGIRMIYSCSCIRIFLANRRGWGHQDHICEGTWLLILLSVKG
jgi:hypothetical protein